MNCVKYFNFVRNLNYLKYDINKQSLSKRVFFKNGRLCTCTNNVHFKVNNVLTPCNNSTLSLIALYSTKSIELKKEYEPSQPEPPEVEPRDPKAHPLVYFDANSLIFDREHALAYTNEVLDDPISYMTVEESCKFLLPFPNADPPTLFEALTEPFGDGYLYDPACTILHLCLERVENDELNKAFDIGDGFNKRAYFLTLHVWLLYRRVERELPEGVLLNRYILKLFYQVLKDWIGIRKVAAYNFSAEFENTQNHMLKLIAELQKCTEDGDLYPYKMSVVFRRVMYDDDVDDRVVDLLTKYTIRQFIHLHNIDTNHIMNAMFLWGDTEDICKPTRLLKRAMDQLIKYGGYRVPEQLKIEADKTKKLK